MGMAAGQARLLSITARLTDNENNGQAVSYAKQRLADQADQINSEYNAALDATKLQVLTGYNGTEAMYSDISYNLMTGYNTNSFGKQYIVTNAKNQVLVTHALAAAFEAGNGDYNTFLNELGYSQVDVDFASMSDDEVQQTVHEAWDAYYKSVGKSFESEEHDTENPDITFGYVPETTDKDIIKEMGDNGQKPIGYAYYVNTDHSYLDVPTASFACTSENMDVKDSAYMPDDGSYTILQAFTDKLQFIYYDDTNGAVCLSSGEKQTGDSGYSKVKYDSESGSYVEGDSIPATEFDEDKLTKFYQFTADDGQVYTVVKDNVDGKIRINLRDKAMQDGEFDKDNGLGAVGKDDTKFENFVYDSGLYSVATLENTNRTAVDADGTIHNLTEVKRDQEYTYKDTNNNTHKFVYDDNQGWIESIVGTSTYKQYAGEIIHGTTEPLNYEGNSAEQRNLYDYAMALSREAFDDKPVNSQGNTVSNISDNAENANIIKYYRNIFNAMLTYGYYTEQNENDTINQKTSGDVQADYRTSVSWFEQQLRDGKLLLRYYSSQEDGFVSTTISDDGAIQEVEDDSAIALIEAKYTQDTEALERKDKKYDLELKKLDTEHSALQTEYDSLKSVVDKNIEKSFNIFS